MAGGEIKSIQEPGDRQVRRGVVAVQVAVVMIVIMGFAALSVDLGAMYNTKADLQKAADSAALAAASKLGAYDQGDPIALATAEAHAYIGRNSVFGRQLSLGEGDLVFGRAIYDPGSGAYDFQPSTQFPDAVKVRLRMTQDSPNGEAPLYFARVLGHERTAVIAEATAMMVPRDIAIVADLSGSHKNDSELKNYRNTDINIWDVWAAFPGGIDDTNSTWGGDEFAPDETGFSPQMAGPGWGLMKQLGWGTETIDASYNPTTDPGLIHLPRGQNWSNSMLRSALESQGYIQAEVDAIMSGQYDNDSESPAWDDRVAVALGLARWNSGIPGGLWEQLGVSPSSAGNGNSWISGGELSWLETFGHRSLGESRNFWVDYINNYASGYSNNSRTNLDRASTSFRNRFGIKTFMNYLIEKRTSHSETPEFANAPTQPMQAVKDSVDHMVQVLYDLETDDRVSLEVYGSTARHVVDLTANYQLIADTLNSMQAAHYDPWTNMGGGITRGIEELTSSRARPSAKKVMIVLTDGNANVRPNGTYNDAEGRIYAQQAAQQAAALGIRLFAVSVGSESDTDLMHEIAQVGSGVHFHAEGTIEQYSSQLEEVFATLGGARPVELIK